MKAFSGKQTKLALALAALAMTASMGAQAVPMSNPALGAGLSKVFLETSPGVLTSVAVNPGNVGLALSGPGNVELGKYGSSPATTLSGDFAGVPVMLSGLVLTDWTANSNALATQYIAGAAWSINANGTGVLTGPQMTAALTSFLDLANLDPDMDPFTPGKQVPWMFVSDPNVSDVNLIGGSVVVGLDGFLDATLTLNTLFAPLGVSVPLGVTAMASEVVKVAYQGNTSYLYGFSATPTGYQTADGSYSGRYTVPIPATLWLMGIGLAALVAGRRR